MSAANADDAALLAKLAAMFEDDAPDRPITNLLAKVQRYELDDLTLPMTLSDPPDCYICSPTVAYVDYALEETRHFNARPSLKTAIRLLLRLCRPIMQATGLDRQVQPNNWLFSTNPVPDLTPDQAKALRDDLTETYPDRAIVIRSINEMTDASTINALKSAGFALLPARQIYAYDTRKRPKPTIDMKRDAALLATGPYDIVPADDFTDADFNRAADLYAMLYLEKYTPLNPTYTAAFLTQAHRIGLLRIVGLRGADQILDGVVGMFTRGNTMTVPILGYDTSKPQKWGLYRMLNAHAQAEAIETGRFYNMSAGAARFKRYRNAEPMIEYTAVYVRHRGWRQRIATATVRSLLDWIGVPLLRRFGL
ncbi:GNAT family N-acetyltransferase [Yoonia sp. 2307UL14-13]|uniref:GNAT family N-acetyltransferase n=1 Tax=Yoonia sp. 2307UL14-13 TaxID=3126506 RepID=UPI003098A640